MAQTLGTTPRGRWKDVRCFHSGTPAHPIYVDHVAARGAADARKPVVMVHGGGHTGACYLATPDGRPGWAPRFADAGRDVFVPDWPGHGRSPPGPDFARLGARDVCLSLLALLEETGPAVLLVHSASGPMAWWMASQRPDLVAGIVAVAPGPPANLLPDLPDDPAAIALLRDDASVGCPVMAPEDRPVWFDAAFAAAYWANAPRFPREALAAYLRGIVPESARILNERFNIGGRGLRIDVPPKAPILVLTGDHDMRHPRSVDAATARYLGAEFVWLPERGIEGNGHMIMLEDNSNQTADMALAWLDAKRL